LLEDLRRFNSAAYDDGRTGGASLGATWAVAMCLSVIALFVLYGCDPDPFKGF
jgi:hypothetical protein